jgi:hypothetical protein
MLGLVRGWELRKIWMDCVMLFVCALFVHCSSFHLIWVSVYVLCSVDIVNFMCWFVFSDCVIVCLELLASAGGLCLCVRNWLFVLLNNVFDLGGCLLQYWVLLLKKTTEIVKGLDYKTTLCSCWNGDILPTFTEKYCMYSPSDSLILW